ncbi:polyketide synthase [Aaosphaeria arxii CBS 175.79]|uniref:Polyketide synthase n=1 Tax=Aaosphaeria arxii CBS 175.79 TaxID=1450172 RepID=A0A6A5XFU0_9PLEO|nr:polyketide synthase [Aaosphaeria arxii CBS 175.79]KAF2012105.1 polyketide synthase [Aaosphaeria arxii CBS 175.79]
MADPVAVTGFAFRFPGDAVTEEAFWDIIAKGQSTMTEVPESRYNINGFHGPKGSSRNSVSCRGGHFIKGDISAFDAPFFAMSPAEARAMDPQLRLMLETAYHALESAGLTMEKVHGTNTSVYVGNLAAEYSSLFTNDDEIHAAYQATGMSGAMLSNRISWFYDLHGPSITIDTACSSGLVGLHLACQSLLQHESEMSLVGGVQLQLNPSMMTMPLSQQGFLSPDSHCYSFDDRANGYSRGEGVGIVVLKLLSKAIEDGDTIRAIIRGTSTNQDGHTPSITQPSHLAQAALIRQAYKNANLDFDDTQYFEAHGTGTSVGDPIEAYGINEVFSRHANTGNPLFVGSVKANIGHLESAAGIAGVIKAVLSLERGMIPPNALLKNINRAIYADDWNMKFPTMATPWPTNGPRRASVNSFGVGGANAHAVLDDAFHYMESRNLKGNHNTLTEPKTNGVRKQLIISNGVQLAENGHTENTTSNYPHLLILSAADEDGIYRLAATLEKYLSKCGNETTEYIQDLAYTLSAKRSRLPWKAFAVGSTMEELQKCLKNMPIKPARSIKSPMICFTFTGQGAQWATMGIDLIDRYDVFRDTMHFADGYLRSLGSSWSILSVLRATASSSEIDDPAIAQPLCCALQIALVDLLTSWGIVPEAVVGHSSGEIAAAYSAGLLSMTSALRVAYYRGEATRALLKDDQKADKGAMLAVALSELELSAYISDIVGKNGEDLLSCGCINSPQNTTVTGVETYIDELARRLQADNIFNRKLNVPVAYHSHQMLKVADKYLKTLKEDGLQASPQEYWIRNLVSTVRFSEALEMIFHEHQSSSDPKPLAYLVEIGPHCALERPIRDTLTDKVAYSYDTTLRRGVHAIQTMQSLSGRLFANGYSVDVQAVNSLPGSQRQPKMLLNLPSYPFNSSRSYWLESRLSQNHRTRRTPRHDFLGNPSNDWNPMKPKWRFTIRESDLPWLSDHKVDGTILYPGSGFLVMVLEAVRSLTSDIPGISGYRIRDAKVPNALVINPEEEGIEAQLHMHSHGASSSNQGAQSWDFWIYSVSGADWKVCFSGNVTTELSPLVDTVSEASLSQRNQPLHDDMSHFDHQDSKSFYKDLYQQGFQFGETFQTLQTIKINGKKAEATAKVDFKDWRQQMKQHGISDHLIHPATLDSLFHVIFAAQYKQSSSLPRVVPTHLSEVYISLELVNDIPMDTLRLHGSITDSGLSGITGNVEARSGIEGKIMVDMRGCKLTTLLTAKKTQDNSMPPTSLFHRVDWKPDISLLSRSGIEDHLQECTQAIANVGGDIKAEIVCRHFMSTTLDEVSKMDTSDVSSEPHLRKYLAWVKNFTETEKEKTAALILSVWPEFSDPDARIALIDEYAQTIPWRAGIVSFCRNLVAILQHKVDPLDILFNQGVAESIYRSPLLTLTAGRLAAYIDLVAHKNSNINILEVGAGTGSTTSAVLDTLCKHGRSTGASPRFNHYDFTDVSPSFFAVAQERYVHVSSRMKFKVFDLERDPEEQGFEAKSYDVIIAAAVIHATASIEKTLGFLKKLLKPGGQLVFSEPTNQRMAATSGVFGVLPGWWLSTEEYRSSGPLLPQHEWNKALLRTGFTELEVALADDVEETHLTSLLVSRVPNDTEPNPDLPTAILVETSRQRELAEILKFRLSALSKCEYTVFSVDSVTGDLSAYQRCISLLEFDSTIFSNLTKTQFAILKEILRACKQVLWVTTKCGRDPNKPEAAMVSGFSKTITRENPGQSFVCLDLNSTKNTTEVISQIENHIRKISPSLVETDLLEEGGVVYIPRVVEAPEINRLRDDSLHGFSPVPSETKEVEDPLELRFTPGQLDSFHFGPDASVKVPLADQEVLIEVKAAGINFRDVMVVLNQLPASYFGYEFAGIVTKCGVNSSFSPGDRVCGLATSGSFRSFVRAKESHVMRMPSDMPFTEAAAVPLAFATAQYSLCHVARLKQGESILIHSAAGGVGQAAIQIAQSIGAIIYVTVSTPEKKRLLMDRYGIAESHCFSSRHTFFAQQLMHNTTGRGVDVVLNSLTGLALTETWRCMAPLGRFVEIGKRDIAASKSLPMDPFERNVSYSSVDLSIVSKLNEQLMAQIVQEVELRLLDDVSQQQMAPYPLSVFTRSKIEDAFRFLQTGQHTGKAVVDWETPDTVQVIPKNPLNYSFDSNATYVITGGLGGIGRSLAMWFTRSGAKHLVLLSRSGLKSDAAIELVSSLEKKGVNVYAPACDISNDDEIRRVIEHVQDTWPPIKGCIHGALVVKNRIFHDYSLEEFQEIMIPKVQGTWNLDKYLPDSMNFFVILCSIAGVCGAVSQSSYAGASTFQDAFARYRHARGRHCVSLDLGIVQDVGYVAERVDVARFLAMSMADHKVLTEEDLQFMVKYACSPHRQVSSPWETQIIGALTTPSFVRRYGNVEDHIWMRMPMFCHLYQMEQENDKPTATRLQADSVESQLAKIETLNEAAAVITRSLANRLARALAVPVEDIDTNMPPFTFGVDSLVAVELMFWFSNEIRADIPVVQILGNSSVAKLGVYAAGMSEYVPTSIREGAGSGKKLEVNGM